MKRAQATIAKDFVKKIAPKGVRINTIVPGSIEIPDITKADGTVELSAFSKVMRDNPGLYQSVLAGIPLGRRGKPEEVASAVLYLSSSLAGFITGAKLFVDGGISQGL